MGIRMTKKNSKILITKSFSFLTSAALIAAVLFVSIPAHAAADNVAICDRLAAHPEDKDKPAEIQGSYDIAKTDVATALKACKAAAAASDAPRRISFELGRAFEFNGQNAEAAKAYRKAVDAGNTTAMVGLGTLLINGNGVKKDETEARMLFEKAANAGDAMAMSNLGALYGAGIGVPVDFATSRNWYEKAASADSSEAMYQLGLMTQDGDGGPKDDAAAKAWFEKAAAHNHGGAVERLGAYAEEGRAGPKDEKVAIEFYKKAADLGSDEAADALKRLQCNFTLKDKDGKVVGNLCYTGN
jgi:TPR repeat protein